VFLRTAGLSVGPDTCQTVDSAVAIVTWPDALRRRLRGSKAADLNNRVVNNNNNNNNNNSEFIHVFLKKSSDALMAVKRITILPEWLQ